MDDFDDRPVRDELSRHDFITTTGKFAAGVAAASALAPFINPLSAFATPHGDITVWFFADWLKDAVTAFEKKHPQIKVKYQQLGYVDTHEKLLTSLAAGSGAPDVSGIDLGYIGVFTAKGGLVDLAKAPYNAKKYRKDLFPYKWQEGSASHGRLVGMPWDVGPCALWYRTDLFKHAGIETDPRKLRAKVKTWNELFALGAHLTNKLPHTKLFADPANDIFNVIVEQQGHGFFQGNKVLIIKKATKPLQMAVQAQKRGLTAGLDQGSPEWVAGFKKDAFATQNNACWASVSQQRDQPQLSGKWRVIRSPGGDWANGGGFLAIPEQSHNKAAAWEFIKFLTADSFGANVGFKSTGGGVFPSYKPAWKDPIYRAGSPYFGGEHVNPLYLKIAQHVPAQKSSPYDRQAHDIIFNEVTNALKQGKDPVKAMQDAQKEVLDRIPGTHP